MKKILVLPGSAMQLPLISRLRERGYYIMSLHPVDNFPTQKYSDEYAIVDILDKNKCLEIAKKFQPDVIMSEQCDIAMPIISYLSEKLGLPSLSNLDSSLYTDKSLMREFAIKHSIPSPAYCKCTDVSQAKAFFKKQQGKCIIKPLDANCSKGVYIVENEIDIEEYWGKVICFSKCENALLIEQYIDGVEFTIDGIVTSHGHKTLAISEKRHYNYNPSIAYELFFSNYNDIYNYDILKEINDYFVDNSTLPIGFFTHAEYKYMDGKFYLIEIGARGGGNYISSDIVPIMSGIDNYSYQIDTLIEGKVELDLHINENLRKRCAVLYFFDVKESGRVVDIQGLNCLSENPHVIRYELRFNLGDIIQKAENDSARIGYYIAYAENKEELRKVMKEISKTFKIVTC